MKIGIDARFYGPENTGLGRYTQNVLQHLFREDDPHEYYVFTLPQYAHLTFPGRVSVIPLAVPHYSLREQLVWPFLIWRYQLQHLYTFHFNAPVLCPVPLSVTIHDVIKSHFKDPATTTRSRLVFYLKRLGYQLILRMVVSVSAHIIVPTHAVKQDLLALYPQLNPAKITPVHEAVDDELRQFLQTAPPAKRRAHQLLYVGNAYPHKNLAVLLQAFAQLVTEGPYQLTLVTKPSVFLERVLADLSPSLRRHLILRDGLSNRELFTLYRQSALLITPSLMEGYGLPGLEALACGTPVVAADIPVYREVYQSRVTYFSPTSVADLVTAIKAALAHPRGAYLATRTWAHVARDIRSVIL